MNAQQSHLHHYVPQWYQRRFLAPGKTTFLYLDLHPDTVTSGRVRYQRAALLNWGPKRCFYRDDLYTLKLGNWTTDEIEKKFFGLIDDRGRRAVGVFSDYAGYNSEVHETFMVLPQYMGAQRLRTPIGLDWIKKNIELEDHNKTLIAMQQVFELHTTMWVEGVWEIVRARNSLTKFIISDDPVTFYNRRIFPGESYPGDLELDRVGTRTLFPLGQDSCLIITHLQFVRNPRHNPTEVRANARVFQQTMKYLLDTQYGRELEEEEVIRINYILKSRANRYIAASNEEWLYPEQKVSISEWPKLDDDWFLLPNLYKVPFSAGVAVGWKDGSSWAMDEYGRRSGNPKYKDKFLHEKEWSAHFRAREEWARKRVGRSVAHVDRAMGEDQVGNKSMQRDLERQGLWTPKAENTE